MPGAGDQRINAAPHFERAGSIRWVRDEARSFCYVPAPLMAARKQGGGGADRRVGVVRRPPGDRKRLTPELEAFAGGDDDALWRRSRREKLDDPRPRGAASVDGVANRDARLVYEARIKRMRRAIEAGDEDRLAEELADAVRLALWRANAVVGFDVMAEAVLGIPAERARELVQRGAEKLGVPAEIADDVTIALWMRAESGLLEASPEARASLRGGRLILEVALERAALALSGVGRRAAPMSQLVIEPQVVLDRPKGVAPLTRIIERDRPKG